MFLHQKTPLFAHQKESGKADHKAVGGGVNPYGHSELPCSFLEFARAALYLHMGLSECVIHSPLSIQSDQRGNARASGQITSKFLTQVSLRLYEIRQPPTSLCTSSNFLV